MIPIDQGFTVRQTDGQAGGQADRQADRYERILLGSCRFLPFFPRLSDVNLCDGSC